MTPISLLKRQLKVYLFIAISFTFCHCSFASTVKSIVATYRNGQVFITWTVPRGTNFQYNLYQSSKAINTSSNLSKATLLGYVRDSSSKNIRQSLLQQKNIYFEIENDANPLKASQGLYVTTCLDNKSHYYAVTVTDLNTGKEDKTIKSGENSLTASVKESVSDPQPVWQDSAVWTRKGKLNDIVQYYTWFGNNQDASNFPAMINSGSYGFNFYIIQRGKTNNAPLYVFYEGLDANSLVGNGLDSFTNVTNCYIIGLDDWLPTANGKYSARCGEGTYWSGYNQNFDVYAKSCPIPTNGVDKMYSQWRYIHTIDWANKYLTVDPTKVYTIGVSAGAFGALLTGMIVPQKIAAVYAVVPPIVIKSQSTDAGSEEMWGTTKSDFSSDVKDPTTGNPIPVFSLMDIKKMFEVNQTIGVPVIYSISGKNDSTVGWKDKPDYFNDAEKNNQGGVYFWDQRQHDGTGANFLDSETMPDFTLYQTNLSYPAFANATSDDNPGDGDPKDGDKYGAYNGYLTWDNNVTDQSCKWSANLSVQDFYVGGKLDSKQYNSVTADVTLRRLQNFNPDMSSIISWTTWDTKANKQAASGSFTYKGGTITIKALIIKKSGTVLTVTSNNCSRVENDSPELPSANQVTLSFTASSEGAYANIQSNVDDRASLDIYDLLGRLVSHSNVSIAAGAQQFFIPLQQEGIYLATLHGSTTNVSKKFYF